MGDSADEGEEVRRPRLLLLAYACSPARGSEAGVGWHRAVESAKHFDTTVFCEEREFSGEIRRYLKRRGPIPGLRFEFVPMQRWERLLGDTPGMWYFALNLWHRRAYRAARRLHRQRPFDVVHQATFCGYREPGYLWKLDVPFVWGPVGGTQNYPWRFLRMAGLRAGVYEATRSLLNYLQLRCSRRVRRVAMTADVVLAANSTNQRDLARVHGVAPSLMPDVGLPQSLHCSIHERRIHRGPLRILWSGGLWARKALPLLIKALERVPSDVSYELRVLGDGPMRRRWRRLTRRTGVEDHTTWLGWLPHEDALRHRLWADVFVFTSLRDTTGAVVLEALGAGAPVVCLDHQGVGDVVTDRCGIKIPVETPRDVIQGLSNAIALLARDPLLRERLSRGARERAEEYVWSRQGERMAEVFRRVLREWGGKRGAGTQEAERRWAPPGALALGGKARE